MKQVYGIYSICSFQQYSFLFLAFLLSNINNTPKVLSLYLCIASNISQLFCFWSLVSWTNLHMYSYTLIILPLTTTSLKESVLKPYLLPSTILYGYPGCILSPNKYIRTFKQFDSWHSPFSLALVRLSPVKCTSSYVQISAMEFLHARLITRVSNNIYVMA